MNTRLLRASPALLIAGGLGLAVVGALAGHGQHAVPAGILVVLSGAAAALQVHRSRTHRMVVPRASTTVRVVPLVPTQRTVRTRLLEPHPALPPLDVSAEPRRPAVPAARRGPVRPPRTAVGRPRHCVLPRGELPHQRPAPGAS